MDKTKIANQAIDQALAGNWQTAVNLNQLILKNWPQDIDALCRLAKAYAHLGEKAKARQTYLQVLKLDKFHPIAKKNLARLTGQPTAKKAQKNQALKIQPQVFLEESGKTKFISLKRLGKTKALLELESGSPAKLKPGKKSISVYSQSGNYLGQIPSKLSTRLLKLIKTGNQYQAIVKSADQDQLTVLVKETKRSQQNSDLPSFPITKDRYQSSLSQSLVARAPIREIENQPE